MESEPKSQSSSGWTIAIIVIVLIVLIIGIGLIVYFATRNAGNPPPPAAAPRGPQPTNRQYQKDAVEIVSGRDYNDRTPVLASKPIPPAPMKVEQPVSGREEQNPIDNLKPKGMKKHDKGSSSSTFSSSSDSSSNFSSESSFSTEF